MTIFELSILSLSPSCYHGFTCGIQDSIKVQGRRQSSAYSLYIQTPPSSLISTSRRLVISASIWYVPVWNCLYTKIIFLYTVDETRSWVSHSLAMQILWLKWNQRHPSTDPATLALHLRTASYSPRTSASYMYTNLSPNLPHDGVEACKLPIEKFQGCHKVVTTR